MEYIFYNKNVPALRLDIEDGYIENIKEVLNPEVLPIIVRYNHNLKVGMREWLEDRSIPSSRAKDIGNPVKLSIKNLGLSLSDQYWFCPINKNFTYDSVNLFSNPFVKRYYGSQEGFSPDFSSNGQQEKYWEIRNEKRVLIKKSRKPFFQEAANEVFASKLLEKLNISHIDYYREGIYSVCETAINKDTEYVPASHVFYAFKKLNNDSNYTHLLRCMDKLNIPVDKVEIENMLAFDRIINNIDRNFGNFGFIRKAEGGEFVGLFPYFDHGNSMWYQELDDNIKFGKDTVKPFYEDPLRQFRLVKESNLSLDNLTDNFLYDTVQSSYKGVLQENRMEILFSMVKDRLEDVKEKVGKIKNLNLKMKEGLSLQLDDNSR